MKVTEKLKEVLSEEDLNALEASIKDMINEEAQKRADLIAEERTNKIDEVAEDYVQGRVDEEVEKIVKDYDEKMEQLEEKLVDVFDKFVDQEISENISDKMLEKVALNETLAPIVDGIKKLFSTNHVELDTEGSELNKRLVNKNEDLEKQLSGKISECMELNEKLEEIAIKHLLKDKTDGLNEDQSERITKMFSGKDFETVEKSIDDFVDIVIKEENQVTEETIEKKDEIVNEDDGIKVEKVIIEQEEQNTVYKAASRLV